MKRSAKLTTVLAVTLLCFASATTSGSGMTTPSEPDCSEWDVSGDWTLVQTNETAPKFALQQTGTTLLGKAQYGYKVENTCYILICDDDYYTVNASVDGWVKGDSFEVTAYWNNGTTGVYTGKIGQQGRIEGATYDKQHPQVQARWYSERTARCSTVATTGTANSALSTGTAPAAVRPQARVRIGGVATTSTLTKCEAAKAARARNSPAAPGLEAQCRAEQASGASAVATAGNDVRRVPLGESPTATRAERFGAGGAAWLAFAASQPESTIKVRVRYKKQYGYEGDTGAFGYVGPTSCNAFSISVSPADGSRQRDLIRIGNDSRMTEAGDYYICNYLASFVPPGQAMSVKVSVSTSHLTEAWKGGAAAQPPAGHQRTVPDATRTATLDPSQPRAMLSFEMVYAPIAPTR